MMRIRSKTGVNKVLNREMIITRWMLILRPAVVTATLGVAILVFPDEIIDKFTIAVIVLGTYLLTLLYWVADKFSGIHRPLLATQIAFDIFIITIIIHYTGGIDSSFVGFYFVAIMCASLFFRWIVTFLFATQAALFYVLYNVLYLYYLGPNDDPTFNPDKVDNYVALQAFLYSVIMYGVGFISSSFAERIIKKDSALISALMLLKGARLDTSDILQSMTNGLITVNMNGVIMYINRAAESILEIGRGEAEGRHFRDVLGERSRGMADIIEYGLRNVSVFSEQEISVETRGGHAVPLGSSGMPLYDTDKSRRGFIVNFIDLTEKKQLLEMIRQADRMAAIGELSAAIAHEIRNPLASISNVVEIMKESHDKLDGQGAMLLGVLERESGRLQRISTDFLKFARVKDPCTTVIDLNTALEQVELLLVNDPRKTDRIIIKSTIGKPVRVRFDSDHLEQVFLNILINSLEVLDGSGEIVITTEGGVYGDNYIRLVVYDNGPGFTDEALGKVFEPFYSTKKEGTGLGLALVRKLVVSNGGRVLARNRPGAGAEIALDVPVEGSD